MFVAVGDGLVRIARRRGLGSPLGRILPKAAKNVGTHSECLLNEPGWDGEYLGTQNVGTQNDTKKDRHEGGPNSLLLFFIDLSGQKVIRRFGKNASTVKSIIDDLANGRSVGVDIHTGTGP
jgi:hypothetical protein